MQSRLLTELGKITGLGGIALGVFLLVFQGVLKHKFLPAAGLNSYQAYQVIQALMILTFGIAAIGIVAWIMTFSRQPTGPVPTAHLWILSLLTLAVLGTASIPGERTEDHQPANPAPALTLIPPHAGQVNAQCEQGCEIALSDLKRVQRFSPLAKTERTAASTAVPVDTKIRRIMK